MSSSSDFGSGALGWIDRGCWLALSQERPGTWSWPRAIATLVVAAVAGVIVFVTTSAGPAFLIGLAIAYGLVLWRARSAYERSLSP